MNNDDLPALQQALSDEYPQDEVHVRILDYGHMLTAQVGSAIICSPPTMSIKPDDWRVWLHRIKEALRGKRSR